VSGDGWWDGSYAVARARGSSHRAEKAKPTEGAGDAVSGGVLDRICPGVVIVAPSVGLPTIQPGGFSPGPDRMEGT